MTTTVFDYHLPAAHVFVASVLGDAVAIRQVEDPTVFGIASVGSNVTFGPYLIDRTFQVYGDATVTMNEAADVSVYSLPTAAADVLGGVLQGAAVADAVSDPPTQAEFNALLTSLRDAGIIATAA